MIRILAERKGLEFIIDIDDDVPAEMLVDPNRL